MKKVRHRKTNTAWYGLYEEAKVVTHRTESEMVVARGWEEGEMGMVDIQCV